MQMPDLFDHVVVLGGAETARHKLCMRLGERGCKAWPVELDGDTPWRNKLADALAQARRSRSPGVLLLAAEQSDDEAFWRSQDALVERLSARPWDIVYLGHGALSEEVPDDKRPQLLYCDMPPGQVSAVAVSFNVLELLLQIMPDGAVDGPLHATDWLSIACWVALAQTPAGHGLAAWPALMRTGAAASGAIGLH